MIRLGQKFGDIADLKHAIEEYEKEKFVQFYISHSRTIESAKRRGLRKVIKPELRYAEMTYSCINAGKYQSRSKGLRPNTSTLRQGCESKIVLKASDDGQFLEVVVCKEEHNHELNKETFQSLPHQKVLDDAAREKASRKLKLRANRKKLVQNEVAIICHKKMQKVKVLASREEQETSETVSPKDEILIVSCTSEGPPSSKCPAAISDKCLDDPDTSSSSRNSIENEDKNNDEENNIIDKNPVYNKNVPAPSDSSSIKNCDLKRKSYQNSKDENLKNDILLSVKDYIKKPKTEEDRFDAVGRTVAFKLRGLPTQQMLLAEKAIFDTLFQAEMKSLTLPKSQQLSNCNGYPGTLPLNSNQQKPATICVLYDPTFSSS